MMATCIAAVVTKTGHHGYLFHNNNNNNSNSNNNNNNNFISIAVYTKALYRLTI